MDKVSANYDKILQQSNPTTLFQSKTKINMEVHYELDYNMHCPCGRKMTLMFYLLSPDTRAE
jgi:hypothetical protein